MCTTMMSKKMRPTEVLPSPPFPDCLFRTCSALAQSKSMADSIQIPSLLFSLSGRDYITGFPIMSRRTEEEEEEEEEEAWKIGKGEATDGRTDSGTLSLSLSAWKTHSHLLFQ